MGIQRGLLVFTTLSWIFNGPCSPGLSSKSMNMLLFLFKYSLSFTHSISFNNLQILIFGFPHPPFTLQPTIICFLTHDYHENEFLRSLVITNFKRDSLSLFIWCLWVLLYCWSLLTPWNYFSLSWSFLPMILLLLSPFLASLGHLQGTFPLLYVLPGDQIHTCDFNFPLYSMTSKRIFLVPLAFITSSPICLVA